MFRKGHSWLGFFFRLFEGFENWELLKNPSFFGGDPNVASSKSKSAFFVCSSCSQKRNFKPIQPIMTSWLHDNPLPRKWKITFRSLQAPIASPGAFRWSRRQSHHRKRRWTQCLQSRLWPSHFGGRKEFLDDSERNFPHKTDEKELDRGIVGKHTVFVFFSQWPYMIEA